MINVRQSLVTFRFSDHIPYISQLSTVGIGSHLKLTKVKVQLAWHPHAFKLQKARFKTRVWKFAGKRSAEIDGIL